MGWRQRSRGSRRVGRLQGGYAGQEPRDALRAISARGGKLLDLAAEALYDSGEMRYFFLYKKLVCGLMMVARTASAFTLKSCSFSLFFQVHCVPLIRIVGWLVMMRPARRAIVM